MVVIAKDQLQFIVNHAQSTYPEECCGFLLGINSEEKWVQTAISVPNISSESRSSRYNIDPLEVVRADEAAQRANLDLLGIYHSHPDTSPQPSQIDREYAWPKYTYIIVSLKNRVTTEVRAWHLSDDKTTFQSEDLRIIE